MLEDLRSKKLAVKLITEFKNSELDFEIDIYGSGSQKLFTTVSSKQQS